MTNRYENVIQEFNKRNCTLLTTQEEYIEIVKQFKTRPYRLNYVASCGHNHIVFYNVFTSRGTGVVCPSCKNKKIGQDKKDKMNNNELSKTFTMEQEFKFIMQIKEYVQNEFEIIKAFDGCKVDMFFRPKSVTTDNWVGIQVKTTNVRHLTYSFHIHTNYKDCLLLFYCCEDESMWLIPENIITNQKKVSIGYYKSKYNIYKVTKDDIINKLNELYNTTSKFNYDTLNTPTNIYQHREQIFRKYRDEQLDFIDFTYENMEGTVYDFKIGDLKIQEKVGKLCNKQNRYNFQLCKNNGILNNKRNQIQYDIGDNDFYWLNSDNKETFYVIPEKELVERNYVGNKKKNTFLNISVNHTKTNQWLDDFKFDYTNIDKDKLLGLLNLIQ